MRRQKNWENQRTFEVMAGVIHQVESHFTLVLSYLEFVRTSLALFIPSFLCCSVLHTLLPSQSLGPDM